MNAFARTFLLALSMLFCATALHVRADMPSVTAVLTSSETLIGEPVQLQIKVSGTRGATPPTDINVPGLDIRYSGQSQLMEGRNFQFTYSTVFNYTVMPDRAGTFKIPPIAVLAGNSTVRTPELTLNVVDGGGGARSSRSARGGNVPIDEKQLAFAELTVTKRAAYVGEMIPVMIRLGFNPRARAQLTDGPNVTGQGFTTQKMPKPTQALETVNGKAFQVLTFKTAIAAARTGTFEVGPVEAKAVVQLPRQSGGNRSPFDLFDAQDPFADPFFTNPFGGFGEQREITIKSETAKVDVKALPPNAPPQFSGAVGNFKMTADVNPKTAQVGDPLTVTAAISGRGNFDRVNAPAFDDEHGWHKYPPSSNFKQDDDIGISGTKSFETVLTPNERKQAAPVLLFSFFDPVKESYVTLKSDRTPLTIEGGVAPGTTPVTSAAAPTPKATIAAAPSAAPAPSEQDILYQLTDRPDRGQSFAPLYLRPIFWASQGIPLLGLIGFVGWKMRQLRAEDRASQRRATLQYESAELLRKLHREDLPPAQYFAEAARAVQVRTALARNVEPYAVDAEYAASAFALDEAKRRTLSELFRQSDEVRYSGGGNGSATVPAERRREVLELIESLPS